MRLKVYPILTIIVLAPLAALHTPPDANGADGGDAIDGDWVDTDVGAAPPDSDVGAAPPDAGNDKMVDGCRSAGAVVGLHCCTSLY